jgi:glycerophosphoryl diester phosphodiesterase
VRVALLDELLTRWPEIRWNIDPKSDGCVEPLAGLLDRLAAWDRVCIGSFSDARLRAMRRLGAGRACTSMGPRAVAVARVLSASTTLPRLGADCVQVPVHHGRVPLVTARFVRAAHRRGLPVHVWTIDDEQEMRRVLDLGVDGIMSDELELLRRVFASRALPLDGRGSIPPPRP